MVSVQEAGGTSTRSKARTQRASRAVDDADHSRRYPGLRFHEQLLKRLTGVTVGLDSCSARRSSQVVAPWDRSRRARTEPSRDRTRSVSWSASKVSSPSCMSRHRCLPAAHNPVRPAHPQLSQHDDHALILAAGGVRFDRVSRPLVSSCNLGNSQRCSQRHLRSARLRDAVTRSAIATRQPRLTQAASLRFGDRIRSREAPHSPVAASGSTVPWEGRFSRSSASS